MRVPVSLAWVIMALFVFTAGLLRRFNEHIPESPFLHPLAGNLLFAAIFVLLLVASRERTMGAVPGRGVRLGSLTPLLLMLLIEKWISLGFYEPLFGWISNDRVPVPRSLAMRNSPHSPGPRSWRRAFCSAACLRRRDERPGAGCARRGFPRRCSRCSASPPART